MLYRIICVGRRARDPLLDAADDYAKSVVKADFEEAGDDDVFRKIRADFDAKSVAQSDHQIRRTMEELLARAVEEVRTAK